MFLTTEVRWFGEGSIPENLWTCFERDPEGSPYRQVRTDVYLRALNSDTLGIKIREGRLEIKHRNQVFGRKQLTPRIDGVVEGWQKLGFILGANQNYAIEQDHSVHKWLSVKKDRILRWYQFNENDLPFPIDYPGGIPGTEITGQDRVCSVEATVIFVDDQRWWSLALEASGQAAPAHEDLRLLIGRLAQLLEPPMFTADRSYGYPYWMQHILSQNK